MTSEAAGWRTLALIPAVSAAILGALYFIGAVAEAAALHHAGVAVADALPMVPLQQILAHGVAVLLSSGPVIAVFGVTIGGLAIYAARYEGAWRTLRDMGRKDPAVDLDRMERRHSQLVRRAITASDEELQRVNREQRELVQELGALAERLDTEGHAVDAGAAVFEQGVAGRIPSKIPRWFVGIALTVGVLLVATTAALASPPLAVSQCLFVALGIASWRMKRPVLSPLRTVMTYLAILTACELVALAVNPPRLPVASISLSSGTRQTGALVAHDGGVWFLIERRKQSVSPVRPSSARRNNRSARASFVYVLVGILDADVRAVDVRSTRRRPTRSLFQRLCC
jgi:hypothetical protein